MPSHTIRRSRKFVFPHKQSNLQSLSPIHGSPDASPWRKALVDSRTSPPLAAGPLFTTPVEQYLYFRCRRFGTCRGRSIRGLLHVRGSRAVFTIPSRTTIPPARICCAIGSVASGPTGVTDVYNYRRVQEIAELCKHFALRARSQSAVPPDAVAFFQESNAGTSKRSPPWTCLKPLQARHPVL